AAEQLRRDVVATVRALGLSDEARQQVVARWDRATVTDVEEVPYDDERGPGPVAPERSGRAGTQRAAGPGRRAERPGVVDEGGPVEAPGAGDGERPSAAGDAPEPAGRDLVDLPAPGQGPGPGEVLDSAGPVLGSATGGRGADTDPGRGRDLAGDGSDTQPAGAVRGERPGVGSEAAGDDDRSEGRAEATAGDAGSERSGADDHPSAEPVGDDGAAEPELTATGPGPALMRTVAATGGEDYRPSAEVSVPSGGKARLTANMAAIEVLRRLEG